MTGFNQEKYSWQQFYETRAEMINQNLPSISGGTGEVLLTMLTRSIVSEAVSIELIMIMPANTC